MKRLKKPARPSLKPAPNFQLLTELQTLGYQKIIGIDEVGRGALAGPLIVAAVELNHFIDGITDSKLLPTSLRRTIAEQIHILADQISIGWATVQEINELGLGKATKLAYGRALSGVSADLVLSDFVRLPDYKYISQAQGDRYFYPTAAASIVAKVYRDQLMRVFHHYFPDYGWETNMGYGTSEHQAALEELGHCSLHRLAFLRA